MFISRAKLTEGSCAIGGHATLITSCWGTWWLLSRSRKGPLTADIDAAKGFGYPHPPPAPVLTVRVPRTSLEVTDPWAHLRASGR